MKIIDDFKNLGITPIIGMELEFYLQNDTDATFNTEDFIFSGITLKKETQKDQYEIIINADKDWNKILNNLNKAKDNIIQWCKDNNAKFINSGKPFIDRSGNGLHIHINFVDNRDNNIFAQENNIVNQNLLFAIGGLCSDMKDSMKHFIGSTESLDRYKYPDFYTPSNISWGANNRTTALRIPEVTFFEEERRIEHRVPCADCNPKQALETILQSIYKGLINKIPAPTPIYGNAFSSQYNLESLI